jgi:threonine dehydrogenase-like Zn-dependent dehydrogenase
VLINPVNYLSPDEIIGHSIDGLLQERLDIPKRLVDAGCLVPLEVESDAVLYTLAEPLAAVIYGVNLVRQVVKPTTAAIVGAGPVGLLAALYLRQRGCRHVILINRSRPRLAWAVENDIVDADEILEDEPSLVERVVDLTDGSGVDFVLFCVPRTFGATMAIKAMEIVRDGGAVDFLAGLPRAQQTSQLIPIDIESVRRANVCGLPSPGRVELVSLRRGRRVYVTGHRGTAPEHLYEAIEVLIAERRQYRKIVTHVVRFEEARDLVEALAFSNVRQWHNRTCIKTVVVVNEMPGEMAD